MFGKSYLELLQGLVELDFKFLCPWKDGSNSSKLSKTFRACFLSPLLLVMMATSFAYFGWNTLPLSTIYENIAYAVTFSRTVGYAILVKKFFFEYKKQINKLLDDRKTMPLDPIELALTDRFCRIEFWLDVLFHLNCYCIAFLFGHAFVYFAPNAYHFPMNFYVIFLPPDAFLFAYELNYLIITILGTVAVSVVASYAFIPLLLMNQSCWYLDMALVTSQDINKNLEQDDDTERVAETKQNLKKFAERCGRFVEWQSEVQELLFWYINLEFQVLSLILCLSTYVLSSTFSGAMLLLFYFCGAQLFVFCWMGTRVTNRIDQLSFEVSKNWYLMPTKQRKALQMILHWAQNMKAFSGMFSEVNLETCRAIFEASYSFYTFLRSTNKN